MSGIVAADPGPTGLPSALTYNLLGPPGLVAGDLLINDLNKPLADLWRAMLNSPDKLARQYESLWRAQHSNRRRFYDEVRDEFNRTGRPGHLLYLLARCVKAAVRYNADGGFNQSPDNRRMGMLPATMRENILATSALR